MRGLMTGEWFLRRIAAALTALVVWAGQACAAPAPVALPDHGAIEAALDGDGALVLSGHPLDRPTLAAFYQKHGFEPIWNDERTAALRRALDEAASQGLDPAAFAMPGATLPAQHELLLTDLFLRYASALTRGRVSPGDFESDWRIASPAFDGAKALDAAIAGDPAAVLADLAPHDPAYQRLRDALAHYRDLARTPWHPLKNTAMRPGDSGDNVRALRDRLAAEGFLNAAAAPDDASAADPVVYDDAVAAAVARFQTTRGLTVDGTAGRATLAALNVSPSMRLRQIRMNLERWRSLPRVNAGTRVEVNVASAMAVLYEDDQPAKTMRVIVGAVIHPTPVLRARMISVLYNPPWNVPSSIIEKEIRPALKRDPRYLQRGNYVYADVHGSKQLVQLPGPKNALGLLKFEMPNPDDIYMHDTPDKRLFELARRTISHGCVRVEDPRDLARLVLDSPDWPREAIDRAIATGQTQSIPLRRTLPVYMLYWTAFVDPDGTVEFRDDVYGRDKRLEGALAAEDAAERLATTSDKASKS